MPWGHQSDGDRDGNPDSTSTSTSSPPKTPITEKQYGVATDIISAGEIQGLVGGLSGVYLNGSSIIDEATYDTLTAKTGTATVTGTAVTNANGLFSGVDLSIGDRYLLVFSAGPTGNLNNLPGHSGSLAAKRGSSILYLPNSVTVPANIENKPGTTEKADVDDYVVGRIRVPGAGPDGGVYTGIIVGQGTHQTYGKWVRVSPRISTDVSSSGTKAFFFDTVHQVSSITNDDTATLATAVENNRTAKAVILSEAIVKYGDTNQSVAYDNAYAYLKRGTRYQTPIIRTSSYGSPGSSFVIGPQTEVTWYSGTGGVRVGGSASATFITPGQFQFSQGSKEEIDYLNVAIEFPSGLVYKRPNGEDGPAAAEFQIILNYKNDSTDSDFTKVLIHGNNYGGSEFISGLHQASSGQNTKSSNYSWIIGNGFDVNYHAQIVDYFKGSLGGFSRRGTGTIVRENTSGGFLQEFRINLEPFQPLHDWKIEIRRISPDAASDYNNFRDGDGRASYAGRSVVKTVEAGINDKFSYPTTAHASVSFAAEDFAQPPARSYHILGRKVKVPANYLTREELGSFTPKYTRNQSTGADSGSYQAWNGTFRGDAGASSAANRPKVYTNNPAWVFYDILTDKENGLGDFVQEADVDKFSLYQIARYCDELVPNGRGGQEPRFTCNVYIPNATEAYKVVKDLASIFRGMLYWINGESYTVQDSPKEPVYTFTTGNVVNGIFSYTYTGDKARPNQFNVTWNNPDEFFKQTVLTVEDVANIQKTGRVLSRNIVAYGCTSEGQARRLADFHLKSTKLETEVVSFKTGFNAMFLRPGDIINVQDKRQHNFESSGRVSTSSTTTSINLDRTVTFPGGSSGTGCNLYLIFTEPGVYLAQDSATINSQSYVRGQLLLEDASGGALVTQAQAANLVDDSGNSVLTQFSENSRVEIKEITNSGTSASTITVSGAFSSAPQQDTIWAISREDDVNTDELKEYRILGMTKEDDGISFSASRYAKEKYDEIDQDVPVETTDYVVLPPKGAKVPSPETLVIDQITTASTLEDGVGTGITAQINWSTPVENVTDTAGITSSVTYRFLSHFEIHHNMSFKGRSNKFVKINNIPGSTTTLEVPNVGAGVYTVKIRAVNSRGAKSTWKEVTQRIISVPPSLNRVGRVARGGDLSSSPSIDASTGLVTISSSGGYTFNGRNGTEFRIDSPTANQNTQTFSGLSVGERGYLFLDASNNSDPWKAVIVARDTVQTDISGNKSNTEYFREVGAPNLGLTEISGTVTVAAGTNTVTGSGTSFLSDFAPDDLILVTTNSTNNYVATSEYRQIVTIESNTSLTVRNAFTRSFSGQKARKQTLQISVDRDIILAEIVRVATNNYNAFFFVASKGDIGEKGTTGSKGEVGSKGEIGTKGEPGGPGDKGSKGAKGDVGAKGVRGDGGDKGDKGGKGEVGAKGVTGDGGQKGDKGPVGDQGAKGVTGDGGAKGPKGDVGVTGAKGVTGDGGAKGATGDAGAKGSAGAPGDGGDKGAKGDTGPKGATGVKGDPGEDVFIIYYAGLANDNLNNNATVDKNNPPLAPDMNGGSSSVSGAFRLTQANGTVTNWYTSSAGLNVFFIASAVAESITQAPRSEWTRSGFLQGDKGDKGALGDKGVKGDVGQKGDTGQKGNQGQKGGKGDLGQKGAAGQKGDQGAKGVTGDGGAKGATGQKGDQGAKGITGDTGQKGAPGQKGDQGAKGGTGNTGAKGATGQKGDQGLKGGTGATGAKGAAGATGAKGAAGATGTKGADGSPGADAPYVVIGFNSNVDTNAERTAAIRSFSGLNVVKVNSVYWDAITGIPYQNRSSEVANPSLTALTGSSGVVNMDSIKLETGSNRVELTGNGMKIYSGNVLRVKIGDLS